jgi:hypothetical protein
MDRNRAHRQPGQIRDAVNCCCTLQQYSCWCCTHYSSTAVGVVHTTAVQLFVLYTLQQYSCWCCTHYSSTAVCVVHTTAVQLLRRIGKSTVGGVPEPLDPRLIAWPPGSETVIKDPRVQIREKYPDSSFSDQ